MQRILEPSAGLYGMPAPAPSPERILSSRLACADSAASDRNKFSVLVEIIVADRNNE